MGSYRIGTDRFTGDSPELQRALEACRPAKLRPLCLCHEPGVPMYIAPVAGHLIVKRMPNSGGAHAPACDSYEPPAELSGLGQVMGTAIHEDPDAGLTALKLDFSLTKTAGRSAPVPSGNDSDSVKTDGHKLSLRGALHYLWDEAGFNRWSPAMNGRRSWATIRKYLLQATEGKVTKGANLTDAIYIPESFSAERKAEIADRRMAQMSKATPHGSKGARTLMIVIGEVKEISKAHHAFKIFFKHLPDCPFMINGDMHERMSRRFEVEMGLWDALEDAHLVAIGTFGLNAAGIASIEEISLMTVTANWIPFETQYDKVLIDAMTQAQRRFMKGLRYNLSTQMPLACLVASDTRPTPTAMYILPPVASQDHERGLQALIAESKLAHWLWKPGQGQMPALPPP